VRPCPIRNPSLFMSRFATDAGLTKNATFVSRPITLGGSYASAGISPRSDCAGTMSLLPHPSRLMGTANHYGPPRERGTILPLTNFKREISPRLEDGSRLTRKKDEMDPQRGIQRRYQNSHQFFRSWGVRSAPLLVPKVLREQLLPAADQDVRNGVSDHAVSFQQRGRKPQWGDQMLLRRCGNHPSDQAKSRCCYRYRGGSPVHRQDHPRPTRMDLNGGNVVGSPRVPDRAFHASRTPPRSERGGRKRGAPGCGRGSG
jgi:hypothetical protein